MFVLTTDILLFEPSEKKSPDLATFVRIHVNIFNIVKFQQFDFMTRRAFYNKQNSTAPSCLYPEVYRCPIFRGGKIVESEERHERGGKIKGEKHYGRANFPPAKSVLIKCNRPMPLECASNAKKRKNNLPFIEKFWVQHRAYRAVHGDPTELDVFVCGGGKKN